MTDLWAALDHLEGGKKWSICNLYNRDTKTYCILGALQAVRGVDLVNYQEYPDDDDLDVMALADAICAQYPTRNRQRSVIGIVFGFNDDIYREEDVSASFEEMRVVMQKAAIHRDEILSL